MGIALNPTNTAPWAQGSLIQLGCLGDQSFAGSSCDATTTTAQFIVGAGNYSSNEFYNFTGNTALNSVVLNWGSNPLSYFGFG
jgi:hypothetical protein